MDINGHILDILIFLSTRHPQDRCSRWQASG